MGRIVVVILVLAALPEEWEGRLPGTVGEDGAVVQVLDADTGEPLAGVRILRYSESLTGARLLDEAETDEFGLADFGWEGEPGDAHWIFDAPGHAVLEEYGARPPEIAWLDAGEVVEGRLLDPFGEPAGGVEVELLLGCGHSPAVRRAVTGPDGTFRMEGVTPGAGDLWFALPGATSDYFPAHDGEIHPMPGMSVRGVVVDPDGAPAAGLVVESLQLHRGPRTVTGPDGSFSLDGVGTGEGLRIYVGEREVFLPRARELLPRGRPDLPLRIVLPPEGTFYDDGVEERLGPFVRVPVRTDGPMGDAVPGFMHLASGLSFFAEDDGEGGLELVAPPGPYAVLPGDPFDARRVTGPERVRIDARAPAPIDLATRPRPRLSLEFAAAPPDDADLHLLVPGESIDLFPAADPPHLPEGGRAAVRVEWGGHVRLYPVGATADGFRPVTIDWPEGLEPLERGGGRFVSLSAERDSDGPVLLLLDAAGKPLGGRTVRVTRRAAEVWGPARPDGSFPSTGANGVVPAGGGGSMSSDPLSAAFLLEVDGFLPRAVPGTEKPPITIRYPAGRLEIEVVDTAGRPLDFTVAIDGRVVRGTGGRLEVRGIGTGEHAVVAAAMGHAAKVIRFSTAGGEVRPLRFELSPAK